MMKGDARPSARERVAAIASDILSAFESGELPHALAQLFIRHKIEVPSRHWTWTNRLIALRRSHVYAAGFRQWQEIGRSHAGIILSRQFSNRQTGELLRQVCRLIDSVSADEMGNTVRNLQSTLPDSE